MSTRRLCLAIALGVVVHGSAAAAWAAPVVIRGTVTSAQARWAAGGARIVTDAVVRADGGDVTVSQLGGTVDGIGMLSIPGAPLLRPGMRASITAHAASPARGRAVLIVDDVVVETGEEPTTARSLPFVRSGPTEGGRYVWWASGCVQVTYAAEGTTHLDGDRELDVLDQTLATWNAVSCSYIDLVAVGRQANAEVGNDGVNLIKFRDVSWCRPAAGDDPERCLPASAAGITTLTYVDEPGSARDGEILDADVEINAVDFAISAEGRTEGGSRCEAELANTMTHELGHALGLAHTCLLEASETAPLDSNGSAVPTCIRARALGLTRVTEATMYPAQACGETMKMTLAADDIDAVCTVYPAASDPGVCEPPAPLASGCCSTSGSGSGSGSGSLLVAAMTILGLRRRR